MNKGPKETKVSERARGRTLNENLTRAPGSSSKAATGQSRQEKRRYEKEMIKEYSKPKVVPSVQNLPLEYSKPNVRDPSAVWCEMWRDIPEALATCPTMAQHLPEKRITRSILIERFILQDEERRVKIVREALERIIPGMKARMDGMDEHRLKRLLQNDGENLLSSLKSISREDAVNAYLQCSETRKGKGTAVSWI